MPRYTAHVRGEWLAVPCGDAALTVGWLGREAIRRYIKNKPDNGGFASADDVRFLVRRCKGLGLLDSEDPLHAALEDNEFVEVGEWPRPGTGRSAALARPPAGAAGCGLAPAPATAQRPARAWGRGGLPPPPPAPLSNKATVQEWADLPRAAPLVGSKGYLRTQDGLSGSLGRETIILKTLLPFRSTWKPGAQRPKAFRLKQNKAGAGAGAGGGGGG